ncbi:MAG: alpha-galactosidase [Muribaculaceae bacterium]|nr:alpha-galactosidase [Muribaculaceae bacterium]
MRHFLTLAAASLALTAGAWDTPTMGWSSWNAYGHRINQDIIKSQADAMAASGLQEAGYKYINIDDGAFKGRDSEGNLVIHPTRFPDGMKPVVDYIHSLGLKAGTYSDAGYNTCASFHGGDVDGLGTGLCEHDTQDIDFLFKELGFDFIKVDFCGGDPIHNADKLDLDERERYTAIAEAIRATGREGLRYNICRWAYPGTWVNDIATSWRTTEDIYLGWESVRGIIAQNLYLSAYARHGGFNDMDMLEVGRGLTLEEDKTHFGMWCIMASPLLIGCDMTSIDDATLALLTNPELIALNQDPLALQAYVVSHDKGVYTLVKDVENLHGLTRAVAFYNPGDSEQTVTLDFYDVNLGGNVKVRDLFERTDIGTLEGAMTVTLPPHSTRIYRLEATERFERYLYEAETAWISAYQELENNEAVQSGIYIENDALSGGAKAGWLGQRADNDLIWRDVYSDEGGEYEMTIGVICGVDRYFTIEVNGVGIGRFCGNSGSWDTPTTITTDVTLRKGDNEVRFYTTGDWMPDIDYMQIVPKGSTDVYAHKLATTIARAGRIDPASLPEALRNILDSAIKDAEAPHATAAEYIGAIDSLEEIIALMQSAAIPYADYLTMKAAAENNAAATAPCTSLTSLREAIDNADRAVDKAITPGEITAQTAALEKALESFVKSDDATLLPGAFWDVTTLIVNPGFNTDTHGWDGAPVWGSNVAEYWNRVFHASQTLSDLKPGYYTVEVNALYRVGANDGGSAYNKGNENIPATFYAADASTQVKSLYCHPISDYPDLTDNLSGTHIKNGYVNSMYGASRAFALGLYKNKVETRVGDDGKMTIGIKCSGLRYDCWCCFDNFRLYYHGTTPAGIDAVEADESEAVFYDLNGIRVDNPIKGHIYIRCQGTTTSKILNR